MATYNGGKYLREQLESFLAQTRLPDELIIVDDCSNDGTIEIIQAFAETAPFVVLWEQNESNLGYTGTFNNALMKTTGDLVFLSDQDDVWFSRKLKIMERYALNNPIALVVMHDAALTDADLNDTGLTKQGQIASGGSTDSSFVMGCCAVIRRELLNVCLPVPLGYKGHDSWIVRMAEGVDRKLVVSDVLQWYRRHDTNTSNFLANRTRRLTRGQVLRHQLAILVSRIRSQEDCNQALDQHRCFLEGVRVASLKATGSLANSLTSFEIKLERLLSAQERRISVRALNRLLRLQTIFVLWRGGFYAQFSGVRSALRDFLLP